MKDGKWKFTKINKVAEFSHFKELQQYVKHIDNELIKKNNG